MNKAEFAAWTKETENSKTQWNIDRVMLANHGTILLYKGGAHGIFIIIEKDGNASIGTYQGAIPHIGEAAFQIDYFRKVAKTADEAFLKVLPKLGLGFLVSRFSEI